MTQILIGKVKMDEEELRIVIGSKADQETMSLHSDRAIEQAILLALKGIRFGSVEIIIHDSRVVQIERKEKMRMDRP